MFHAQVYFRMDSRCTVPVTVQVVRLAGMLNHEMERIGIISDIRISGIYMRIIFEKGYRCL